MKRKLIYAGLATAGLVAALLGGLYLAMTLRFNPSPPAADFPRAANALEAQRQDLEQFKRLIALDRSYSPQARVLANRSIDALRNSSQVLSWGAFRVALMRVAALADNGHTGVYSSDALRPNAVPLRVTEFSDGLYVLRAKEPDLLGARVEKIDGIPVDDVLKKLDALHGGTAPSRRTSSVIWVQSPTILNGLGIAPKPDLTLWTLRLRNGKTIERALHGETMSKQQSLQDETRWLSPEPIATETKDWRSLLSVDDQLPLPWRDFNKTFRREWIGTSCVLYLQMKAVEDGPDEKIATWTGDTEDLMSARPPCALIFDLRYNGGGDYTNTWRFTHKLPQLMQPGARVYLLTSPQTFSAAITTTAFVKETFGERAVILGEPVGDRMRFLSEGNHGCLPNSKICFHYSTGMHDYAAPCTDWRVCYWLNWIFPVRVKTLNPDERITFSFADYREHHDPVFARAVALAMHHEY